jgi:hypothetical protein
MIKVQMKTRRRMMRKMIKWMIMMMINKRKGLKKVGLAHTTTMMMKMNKLMLRQLGFILCTRHREIVGRKTNNRMTSSGDHRHKHRHKEAKPVTSE